MSEANEVERAAERLRAFKAHPSYLNTGRHYTAYQESVDKSLLARAYLAQSPTYAALSRERDELAAKVEKLTNERNEAENALHDELVKSHLFSDPTPLTPDAVMEILPKTDDYEDRVSGRYGLIEWVWFGGKGFSLTIGGVAVRLSDWTIGRFRSLVAALGVEVGRCHFCTVS